MVVLGQVVGLVRIEATRRSAQGHGRGTIDLDVLDGKAAGIKGRQAVVAVLHDHTRGFLHGIGEVRHVPVLDGLLCHHRHRLRYLAQPSRCLGADTGQAGGVGAGVLGHLAHTLALDGKGVQLHGQQWRDRCRDIDPVVFDAVVQVSLAQQDIQRCCGLQMAVHSGRLPANHQVGLIQNLQAGLPTQ
ncbi:hypothetical protein D3C76_804630 [compost metagenome]